MKSEWMIHRGRRFIYCNFKDFGLDVGALQKEVEAVDEQMCREPEKSVLALADLRGTVTSRKVVDIFKESATRTNRHVLKQAVVGVTGIRKILAQAVAHFSGQALVLFDTVEEAKDWLANDRKEAGIKIEG
jgi:hypothetical protein